MKRICCIALILLPFGLFGQNEVTGIGFIDLKLYKYLDEYSKTEGLDLYKSPGGEVIACLEEDSTAKYVFRKVVDSQGFSQEFSMWKSGFISAEFGAYPRDVLECYEEKDGFVQVKINDKKYWISLNDLAVEGAKLIRWTTHLSGISGQMRVLYSMNLRTTATVNSDRIMVVRKVNESKNLHLVKMTGNFEGNWAEVEVHIWEENNYCDQRAYGDRIIKGWMKYLDDKGFPNVFPVSFPCC